MRSLRPAEREPHTGLSTQIHALTPIDPEKNQGFLCGTPAAMTRTMLTNKIAAPVARCCYACDDVATGWRDRRPEGGKLEPACARHAEPTIRVFVPCCYCGEPTRKGSLAIDSGAGEYAHHACHAEACA